MFKHQNKAKTWKTVDFSGHLVILNKALGCSAPWAEGLSGMCRLVPGCCHRAHSRLQAAVWGHRGEGTMQGVLGPPGPLSGSCRELCFRAAKKTMVLLRVPLQLWPISFPWLFSRREFGIWLRNAFCFFAGKSWTNYWARNAFQKHHSEIILLIRDLLRALSSFYKLEQPRVWMF